MFKKKLEILGNGSALNNNTTSYLLNDNILIDCSPFTIDKLMNEKIHIGITPDNRRITGTLYESKNTRIIVDEYEKIIYYLKKEPLILENIKEIFITIEKDATHYILEEIIEVLEGNKLDLVDNVFITHRHQDHIGGIEPLLIYKRYIQNDFLEKGKLNLNIYAGEDFFYYYSSLGISMDVNGYIQDFQYNPFPINDSIRVMDFDFKAYRVNHVNWRLPSFSFEITNLKTEDSIFLTGDIDSPLKYEDINNKIKNKFLYTFHDMGWTGLPIMENKVHPTEEEVLKEYGKINTIIGIHVDKELNHFQKAKNGEIFLF